MTFIPAPNTAEAVINYSGAGQPMANVLHFEHAGGYDQTAIDLLATVIDAAVDAYLIPLIGAGIDYLFTKVTGLASQNDLTATVDTNAQSGSSAGTTLPQNQSYAIGLRSNLTGRSARGRFYMPPTGNVNYATPRAVGTTYSNNAVDAVADMLDDAATAGWNCVITSYQTNKVPRTTAENFLVVTIGVHDLNIDTQRRRVGK